MNNTNILKLIQAKYSIFSKGQRLIAEYITENYDKAAFMTASKLGRTVGVSESTVVRFAIALEFSGYPKLQEALQELIKNKLTTVQRLNMTDDLSNTKKLYKEILKADIENIKSTIDGLDEITFNEVVDKICSAEKVYVLGLRSSSTLAAYFGFYLGFILKNVKVVVFGTSDVFEQLLKVDKNDIVIGIGYPRYSRKTLEALKYVREQGCKVVGITDSYVSPIANLADYPLIAASNLVSLVDSLVAPMSLINSLIIAIANKNKQEVSHYFTKLEQIWDKYNIYDGKEKFSL
ncbi:MurR/RpiR family transcriptional regulator [Abyssisolibacter fermentans]|uniref:MurR/RpiR family transcriptional regulator n=1 Tax=Abyssisolibacter fermentans TaxID=1766203 RepID=UPI00083372F0|nr:MurR/RpiR family transcriptional regulator [Abyssisolibacter fermentans]